MIKFDPDEDIPPSNPVEMNMCRILAGKFTVLFFLTDALRSSSRADFIPSFIDLSKAYINQYSEIASWVLAQCTNQKIFSELLHECTIKEMSKFTIGIMYCSMLKAYSTEKVIFESGDHTKSSLLNFFNFVVAQTCTMKKRKVESDDCYQLISRFILLGPEARAYAQKKRLLKKLLACYGMLLDTQFDDLSEYPYLECWQQAVTPAETGADGTAKKKNILVSELGSPAEFDERFMLDADEAGKETKVEKTWSADNKKTFLIEAIAMLLRTIGPTSVKERVSKNMLFTNLTQTVVPASKEDQEHVKIVEGFLSNFFKDARNSRIAQIAITKAFAHLSFCSPSFFDKYLNSLKIFISQAEGKELKAFGFALKEAIDAVSQDDPKRCISAILLLIDLIKEGLKESHEANPNYSIAEAKILLAIASTNSFVYDYLKMGPENYAFFVKWLSESPKPPSSAGYYHGNKMGFQSAYYSESSFGTDENTWNADIKLLQESFSGIKQGLPLKAFTSEFSAIAAPLNYYSKFLLSQIIESEYGMITNSNRYNFKIIMDEMVQICPEKLPTPYSKWELVINENLRIPEEQPLKKKEEKKDSEQGTDGNRKDSNGRDGLEDNDSDEDIGYPV